MASSRITVPMQDVSKFIVLGAEHDARTRLTDQLERLYKKSAAELEAYEQKAYDRRIEDKVSNIWRKEKEAAQLRFEVEFRMKLMRGRFVPSPKAVELDSTPNVPPQRAESSSRATRSSLPDIPVYRPITRSTSRSSAGAVNKRKAAEEADVVTKKTRKLFRSLLRTKDGDEEIE